jgi:hypothetical protein
MEQYKLSSNPTAVVGRVACSLTAMTISGAIAAWMLGGVKTN